ncbi:type II toxin-antitoxin system VapC family toxin [Ottowia sp. SB7-C50]|uniref:type II toxin-antitoxin system VapC family toxin n=1 Tax=Ottowia sp. SB7-C50 TaxID=3081231 RepID=UPI002955CB48|nr:type II toxin-antitoxin system VapC family toxin [Ottowia sp. SB7-C50]WOP15551.1 type II toxin-antitoxin system VapC family toxin [Ottowia sp. SB7-C50]
MRVLFDTSALYKRYDTEPGHDRVMAISDGADEIVVAPHCKAEIASALNRQRHDGQLTLADYTRIFAVVQRDFGGFTAQAFGPAVEMLAIAAMESARLRAMDALHIATAQQAQVDLFVTADRRQASVARAVGLKTELIGEPDAS